MLLQIVCNAEHQDSFRQVKDLESQIYAKQQIICDKDISILDEEEKLQRFQIDRIIWYRKGMNYGINAGYWIVYRKLL